MNIKLIIITACALALSNFAFAQEGSNVEASQSTPSKELKVPPQFKARILKQFDKDGDAYLNSEELAAAKAFIVERRAKFLEMQKRHAKAIVKTYDKDGDSKLDEEELIPLLEKQARLLHEAREGGGKNSNDMRPIPAKSNEAGKETPPSDKVKEGKRPRRDGSGPNALGPRDGREARRGGRANFDAAPQFRHPQPEDLDELALPADKTK